MVFTFWQLQEKAKEQRKPLDIAFVKFNKAFDTMNLDCLWGLLGKFCCPPKLILLIQQLHTVMQAQVQINGNVSQSFLVAQGVKQGCVLAPTLTSIYLEALLKLCPLSLCKGVYISTRFDGTLFNLRRLKSKTKTRDFCVHELLHADDSALVTSSKADPQAMLVQFSATAKSLGLTINLTKTEVMWQLPPGTVPTPPSIVLDKWVLMDVQHFCYLGSTVCVDMKSTEKLKGRLQWQLLHLTGLVTKCGPYLEST